MRIISIVAVLVFVGAFSALAERAFLSSEQKDEESTHVVFGTVKAIYSREEKTTLYGPGTVETRLLLEIEVDSVEKGEGIEEQDLVYARCWRLKKRGEAGLVTGPSGHAKIPQEGQSVRAFLAKGRYLPTGQKDRGWGVLYPNGEDYWDDQWTEIEEDFREMQELGANVVRIHLQFGPQGRIADAITLKWLELFQERARSGVVLQDSGAR